MRRLRCTQPPRLADKLINPRRFSTIAVADFTASLQAPWALSGASFTRRIAKALGSLLQGQATIQPSCLPNGVCSPLLPTEPNLAQTLGSSHVPLTCLLGRLDAPALLLLVTAFMCERRILLISQAPSVASACTLALLQLMQPLQWCHTCVPFLPLHLSTHISAPQPLIMGISPAHLARLNRELGPSAVGAMLLIDLDSSTVLSTKDSQPLPDLTSRAGGGLVSHHVPRCASAAQSSSSHLHAAAARFQAAHTAGPDARIAVRALASVLPGPLSPAAAPLPGKQPADGAQGVTAAALQKLSHQWSSAMTSVISAPRLLSESSALHWDARSQSSLSAAHAVQHTLDSLAPQPAQDTGGQAAGSASDLLGIDSPQQRGASAAPPAPTAPMGSRAYTGPNPAARGALRVTCSFIQAATPLVPHMASLSAGSAAGGDGFAPSGGSAAPAAAGSGGYLNKLGRKLKHSIASSSLGQAVGREVRQIRSDGPSQADMWQPHDCLLRQGGESLGERLARELEDAYSNARACGYFDEAYVRGSILAFLALLLSSAHSAVRARGSGASLEWTPEHFAQSVMDARMRLLANEMSGTQMLCSFALGMFAAHAGLVPGEVRDATRHPQLHKQGHFTSQQGQRLYLSTLLAGQYLLEDSIWQVALGSDAQLRTCSVAQHTFGDVRRRVVEALRARGKQARATSMQHLLVSCSQQGEGTEGLRFSPAMLAVHLRVLGAFSRELGGLGLRAAAADWALWRPAGCSMSTDQVVTAANEGGSASAAPEGGAADLKGLIDLLLAATSDSTPSNRDARQLNQLVALLSHLPAARAAITGVALLRLSDCVAAAGVLAPVQGLPTADAVRHGAVPLHIPHLQWRWASWRHGMLAARLLLCMLLHGAPAARASVALLAPLLQALLHPNLGSLVAAATMLGSLGGTLEGAAVASAASAARARRSAARSIAAKVAFGLSGGRAASITHVADGMGSGQPLAGTGSLDGAAWCGEPPNSEVTAPAAGGLPPAVQALLRQPHCDGGDEVLTAQALNVKHAVENGHGSGLGVLPCELQAMQRGKAKHGVAALKSAVRLLLRLLVDDREWYRTRLAAQQAGALLPLPAQLGVVTGAANSGSEDANSGALRRHVFGCHALFVPAPLPAVVDMRARHLQLAAGQQVLHPWDVDFMQLRGEATLLKRLPRLPVSAFQALPRVMQTVGDEQEPPSPFAGDDPAPADGAAAVSPALSKLHSMFMPVGWNSRSHPQAMRMASIRSPKYVQHVISTHTASTSLAVADGSGADTVQLQACGHGLGGQGHSKLKHRRAHSISAGPVLPQESQASDLDFFAAPSPVAAAREPLRAAQPAADDAWGSDVVSFD